MIPRADYPYVQRILVDTHMPTWRKAEKIKAFDEEKRDKEARGSDRRLKPWRAARLEDLEREIEGMKG